MNGGVSPSDPKGQSKVSYSCWWGLRTCSFSAAEVFTEFNDDLRLAGLSGQKNIGGIKPEPMAQPKAVNKATLEEKASIEIVNKALCLLGLMDAKLANEQGWEKWGEATIAALAQFQRIANVPPGKIGEAPAPGKVIGQLTAVKLFAALQSLQSGGIWQNAARAAQLP
jgi:hypothetical protein